MALIKLTGWIFIAVSLARGISQLAASLPASDAAQLLHLLFNTPRTAPGLIDALVEFTTSGEFIATLVFGFCGALLRGGAAWGQQVFATRAALGEKEQLREQLVRHRLAAAGAHADRAGQDTVLASKGLDGLDDYYTDFLPALVSALIIPIGLGGWILLHDWISAVILVLTIPLIPLFMILIGRFTEHRVDEAASGLNKLSHHLLELARGLPVLVGLRRAGMQRKSLQRVSDDYQQTTMNTLKAAFMSGLALELLASLSVAIIAVVIGIRLVNGSMELYVGLMVLTLAAEVYLPFRDIGSAFHASEDGMDALKRARAQINQPEPKPMAAILDTGTTEDDVVELNDVTISYKALHEIAEPAYAGPEYLTPQQFAEAQRNKKQSVDTGERYLPRYNVEVLDPVVQDYSLRMVPGQYTVLGDASGSGKSTLLSAISGLLGDTEAHFSGSITGLVDRPISYLSQHPAFVADTAGEELITVIHGTLAELNSENVPGAAILVEIALRSAGLPGAQSHHIDDLSPGERRRLGFARVLARLMAAATVASNRRAWLVVLDEPTAHLDTISASLIRRVIRQLAAGILPNGAQLNLILLVASHDAAIHADADQLIGNSVVVPLPDNVSTPTALPEPVVPEPVPKPTLPTPRSRVGVGKWLQIMPLQQGRLLAGIGWSVAALLAAGLLSALSGWLIVQAAYEPPILYLLAVIVAVRFFGTGRAVFRYAERLAVHEAVLSWANKIRLRVWDSLGSQATQWNRLTRSGGALSVLISDIDQLRDAVPRVIVPIPAAIITWAMATGIVAFMAPGSWWPAAVAGIAAFVLVPLLVRAIDARTSTALADHRTAVVATTSRLFMSAADMAANGMSSHAADDFAKNDLKNSAPLKRNAIAAGLGEGLTSFIAGWAAVQTMWVAISHGISAPNTALVVMLMLAMAEPFGLFNQATHEARTLNHQLGKLLPLLEESDSQQTDWITIQDTRDDAIGAIDLQNVTVSYDAKASVVLDDVSLHAARGDFVVVTGPSGSGKSTLLAVLLGFLRPQSGSYTLTAPTDNAATALQHVAWCPQEAYLFDSTLRGNLTLARDLQHRPSEAELLSVLDTVGLSDWLAHAPNGLDTRLGPSGHFISGGQRQRVAVARALLANAQVVLLDEPTAHLGADEAAQLIADLKVALADRITVMVTHDQRFADVGTPVQL